MRTEKSKRIAVDFNYEGLNPTFLKWMAKIVVYADSKYGAWSQYMESRLIGEKSPPNHIKEHLRAYVLNESYDHFDNDPRWHLVAIAYNAMMEFFYHSKFGPYPTPWNEDL